MGLEQKFLRDFGKAALIHKDREIPYAELISMVSRFSRAYRLERGARVAVFAENRPEWIYAFFSAWAKGGIAVPIDYLSPAPEVAYILADCQPAAVFCSSVTREVLIVAIASAT